jgi:hypothetical protein
VRFGSAPPTQGTRQEMRDDWEMRGADNLRARGGHGRSHLCERSAEGAARTARGVETATMGAIGGGGQRASRTAKGRDEVGLPHSGSLSQGLGWAESLLGRPWFLAF